MEKMKICGFVSEGTDTRSDQGEDNNEFVDIYYSYQFLSPVEQPN